MGHLPSIDATASMSARLQKAAVLLQCRALALGPIGDFPLKTDADTKRLYSVTQRTTLR